MGITIEQLLTNKGVIKDKTGEKTATLKIKSFLDIFGEDEITIKSLDPSRLQELTLQANNNAYKLKILVVYNAVTSPDLKSKELQAGYECKTNPLGIIDALFTPLEVRKIADEVSILSRLETRDPDEVVLEIKNS